MKKLLTILSILFVALVFIAPIQADAAVSAGVKPGSFFYFFDTAFENVGLFFTFNSENKAKKALEYADERLAEIEEIAEEKNPDAVKTAIANYESNIALATGKSKDVKDKGRAETLLTSIADNATKNQEVLSAVLIKVPEEAREAITQAISASRKGYEEATKQITELKGEVEQLKKEVRELKQKKDDQQASEMEKLRNEVEELKKIKPAVQNHVKPVDPQSNREDPKPQTFKLPNGAIVDEQGNVLNKDEMNKARAAEEQQRILNDLVRRKQEENRIAEELIHQKAEEAVASAAEEKRRIAEENKRLEVEILAAEQRLQKKEALLAEYNTKKLNLEQQIVDRKAKYYADYAALTESFRGRGVTTGGVQPLYNELLVKANRELDSLTIELERLRIEYLNKINSIQ